MVINIRHAGIVVRDLYRAKAFYQELGLTVHSMGIVPPEDSLILYGKALTIHYCKMSTGGQNVQLELYFFPDENFRLKYFSEVHKQGFNHVALTVKNIEKAFAFFEKKKSIISEDVVEIDKHLLFFALDLDGNLLELVEPIL